MKTLKWLAIVLVLLALAAPVQADTAVGTVTEITGQRVTITNDGGAGITVTIENTSGLQVGHRVQVDYTQIGDALLATRVLIIP